MWKHCDINLFCIVLAIRKVGHLKFKYNFYWIVIIPLMFLPSQCNTFLIGQAMWKYVLIEKFPHFEDKLVLSIGEKCGNVSI